MAMSSDEAVSSRRHGFQTDIKSDLDGKRKSYYPTMEEVTSYDPSI